MKEQIEYCCVYSWIGEEIFCIRSDERKNRDIPTYFYFCTV